MTRSAERDHETAALVAVLMEIERYIADQGWEQSPRLFALVATAELRAAEPALAPGLDSDPDPDALTAIEQDEFAPGTDLTDELTRIQWPDTVAGCAVTLVRTFLPSSAEADMPDDIFGPGGDPEAAARYVDEHPDKEEIRVVVGVDRAGHRHGIARLASQPDELLAAEDLIPGLASLLTHTLT